MKITKEDLIVQVKQAELMISINTVEDEKRRREFAKAFNWLKKRGVYDFTDEVKTPSWEEIFVETGKLIAGRDFRDFDGNISELECKLESLESAFILNNKDSQII